MKMRWKALASVAVAAALVLAPLTVAGASAHTGDLHASANCDTGTGTYTVTYTLQTSNVPQGRVGSTNWRVGTSSFDGTPTSAANMTRGPVASTGSETITLGTASLPGDTQGNGPWVYAFTTWPDGNGGTITKGSDTRVEGLNGDCTPPKKVFVCKYVGTPGVNEHLQTGNNPISVSVSAIPEWDGTVPSWFADQHGRSYAIAYDSGQDEPTLEDCAAPEPTVVVPNPPVVKDLCETADDHYGLPALTEGIDYSRDGLDIIATLQDGHVFGQLPAGWTLNEEGGATYAFNPEQFTDVNCEQEVPLPALYAADPVPPTCDTAGALPDLSEVFPHVTLSFDRPFDGPGVYTLTADAAEGYEFPGGQTQVSREVTVDGAIGFQNENSEAPCFVAIFPQPAEPTFADECGIENDSYTVPDDTAEVVYDVTEDGDTVLVEAVLVDEADEFAEGTVTSWSFTFTDEACPTATPVEPAPPALASTGGADMMPWGVGAAALLIAGAALIAMRRFARR